MKNEFLEQDTYFKDKDNNIYFFEKGTDINQYIPKHLMQITNEKASEMLKPSLKEYKSINQRKVSNFYKTQNKDFIEFEDNKFDFNEKSLENLKNILTLNQKTYEIITYDNKIVKLSSEKLKDLIKNMIKIKYDNALNARKIKNEIEKAKDYEKIDFLINDKGIL